MLEENTVQKTETYHNEFKSFHPVVNFFYFWFAILFSMFLMHPVCLVVSLFCGLLYSFLLKGKKSVKNKLIYMIPIIVVTTIVNPLFNHEGATIIAYFSNGNPLTLESIIYGISSSLMFVCVICWFGCFNEIMTSDKFIYLFGKTIPSLSLVLSMALRFVPRFSRQTKKVINAQKCIGNDISKGNIFKKIKNGLTVLSIMITWSLENAIDTADSMKSRGYGLFERSSFSIFRFQKRDKFVLSVIFLLSAYIIFAKFYGLIYVSHYPVFQMSEFSFFNVSAYFSYFILLMIPVIIEISEVRRWNVIKLKI